MSFEDWWGTFDRMTNLSAKDDMRACWDAATYAANVKSGDSANEAEKVERRKVAVDKVQRLFESESWAHTVDAIIKAAQG
jgi:hypothetical protein